MEILGKLLSLVLLLSLGVVAASVYILEQDNKPESTNVIIENDYSSSQDRTEILKYRQELRDFQPIDVPERNIKQDRSLLWDGHSVKTFSYWNMNVQANDVANKYKLEDINREVVYWHAQYKDLIKDESNKEPAKIAYLKYKIFKEAARIKTTQ